ncbi:hypothetical protein [Bifidobacterium biavatii]|uniref:Uncharacterized protein n=1 Tax=Bifidobacterium biavatii DSM 23969 TaxID=1437608 RepID=A0A086ZYW6_9BIFI|nr:hypothetical protein [Bifidobacterium biavatii]KFI51716.1 hypothetical protein BBIA_0629 [Bifidobacterium biavatii DSM 23969]
MCAIDHVQLALNDLADVGLGNDSPAEAFIIGWQAGWDKCLEYVRYLESKLDKEDLDGE